MEPILELDIHTTVYIPCKKASCGLYNDITSYSHTPLGVENVYGPLDGSVSIRIPNTFSEGEMATPSLVWPARPGVPGDCYCPPYENLTLVKFSDCLITCETSYSIRSDSESIHFTNLTSQMNNTPVHFVTLTDQCDFPDCFIRTIVASYKIIVVGKCIHYVQ